MKRLFAGAASAALLALFVGACDDTAPRGDYAGAAGDPQCGQYATCGACTPALGCGWCTTGAGTGLCVATRGDCPRASTVSFTWERSGCQGGGAAVLADASVRVDASAPRDAAFLGDATSPSDGASADAATDAP